jgi:hypothetical protein
MGEMVGSEEVGERAIGKREFRDEIEGVVGESGGLFADEGEVDEEGIR